ncbi:hypothetical protein [uncultured Chryseobacterium sp.]|uniref:hypothetical protein n=1 Tax=uncultured Chryseobacterium sp. TaxID=259322 RepID=UPI0025F20575|nr:hypothetical protein [uncultured Chryseobacterium sp.]
MKNNLKIDCSLNIIGIKIKLKHLIINQYILIYHLPSETPLRPENILNAIQKSLRSVR